MESVPGLWRVGAQEHLEPLQGSSHTEGPLWHASTQEQN